MPEDAARIPRLDGLRGVAILLVVYSHQGLRLPTDGVLGALYEASVRMGWCGVDLFFVLSGFLITGILLRTRESPDFFRVFYARRTLRIFPIYYLWLAFMLLVVPGIDFFARFHFAGGAHFSPLWYWLYASNIGFALVGGFPHTILALTWSLAIEEQFYLVWPQLVRRLGARGLLRACATCIALAPCLRGAWLLAGGRPLGAFVLTPCRLDCLAVGAAIALVAGREGGVAALQRWSPRLLAATAAGIAALVAWRSGEVGEAHDALVYDPWVQVVGYSLIALFFGAVLVGTAFPRGRASGWLEWSLLRRFGRYSYAMYLTHTFVGGLVVIYMWGRFEPSGVLGALASYAFEWALMLATAMASWWAIERHFARWKRRFAYAPGGGRPPDPAISTQCVAARRREIPPDC